MPTTRPLRDRLRLRCALLMFFVLLSAGWPAASAAAGTWYVATSGSDANDCLTPLTPCATIGAALGKASDGDTISVADGTYGESLVISKSVTIAATAGASILDATRSRRALEIATGATVTISDLAIQNGIAGAGGGVLNAGTLTLERTIIRNNFSGGGGGRRCSTMQRMQQQGSPMTTTELALAQRVGAALQARGWTLATAESCTGGLIGHTITEVAGSSAYYQGGIVAYSNAVKQAQLGVPQATLDSVGAVSAETARAMAEGARAQLQADVAVATTGIAGPGGGSAAKPVGLVFIAVASADATTSQRYVFSGDRSAIKQQTAQTALQLVLDALA